MGVGCFEGEEVGKVGGEGGGDGGEVRGLRGGRESFVLFKDGADYIALGGGREWKRGVGVAGKGGGEGDGGGCREDKRVGHF